MVEPAHNAVVDAHTHGEELLYQHHMDTDALLEVEHDVDVHHIADYAVEPVVDIGYVHMVDVYLVDDVYYFYAVVVFVVFVQDVSYEFVVVVADWSDHVDVVGVDCTHYFVHRLVLDSVS